MPIMIIQDNSIIDVPNESIEEAYKRGAELVETDKDGRVTMTDRDGNLMGVPKEHIQKAMDIGAVYNRKPKVQPTEVQAPKAPAEPVAPSKEQPLVDKIRDVFNMTAGKEIADKHKNESMIPIRTMAAGYTIDTAPNIMGAAQALYSKATGEQGDLSDLYRQYTDINKAKQEQEEKEFDERYGRYASDALKLGVGMLSPVNAAATAAVKGIPLLGNFLYKAAPVATEAIKDVPALAKASVPFAKQVASSGLEAGVQSAASKFVTSDADNLVDRLKETGLAGGVGTVLGTGISGIMGSGAKTLGKVFQKGADTSIAQRFLGKKGSEKVLDVDYTPEQKDILKQKQNAINEAITSSPENSPQVKALQDDLSDTRTLFKEQNLLNVGRQFDEIPISKYEGIHSGLQTRIDTNMAKVDKLFKEASEQLDPKIKSELENEALSLQQKIDQLNAAKKQLEENRGSYVGEKSKESQKLKESTIDEINKQKIELQKLETLKSNYKEGEIPKDIENRIKETQDIISNLNKNVKEIPSESKLPEDYFPEVSKIKQESEDLAKQQEAFKAKELSPEQVKVKAFIDAKDNTVKALQTELENVKGYLTDKKSRNVQELQSFIEQKINELSSKPSVTPKELNDMRIGLDKFWRKEKDSVLTNDEIEALERTLYSITNSFDNNIHTSLSAVDPNLAENFRKIQHMTHKAITAKTNIARNRPIASPSEEKASTIVASTKGVLGEILPETSGFMFDKAKKATGNVLQKFGKTVRTVAPPIERSSSQIVQKAAANALGIYKEPHKNPYEKIQDENIALGIANSLRTKKVRPDLAEELESGDQGRRYRAMFLLQSNQKDPNVSEILDDYGLSKPKE